MSPTECGASLCVIKKPRKRGGQSPLEGCKIQPPIGVVAPGEKKINTILPELHLVGLLYITEQLHVDI